MVAALDVRRFDSSTSAALLCQRFPETLIRPCVFRSMGGFSANLLSLMHQSAANYCGLERTACFALRLGEGSWCCRYYYCIAFHTRFLPCTTFARPCFKVDPRIKFFYIWFGLVTTFLLAAIAPALLPFALPAPWTGIVLAILVLSVCTVPLLYGQIYLREATLGVSRESSTGGDGIDIGDEIYPLLGSSEGLGGIEGIDARNLTWMQCLQVTFGPELWCMRFVISVLFPSKWLTLDVTSLSPGCTVFRYLPELHVRGGIRTSGHQQHHIAR